MDKDTRNAIEKATQRARQLLRDDFTSQLEGTFDVLRSGNFVVTPGAHLSPRQVFEREKIVAAIEHKRVAGMDPAEAVADYVRDAAFTTLNRFAALKMLEARELVQECISKGEQSSGYREFCGLSPGVGLLPDGAGYRLYIESLFDELSTEIKVLFDRRDSASVLWPKRQTFEGILDVLNAPELSFVWAEDETIGWVYQYFNSREERQAMRDPKQGGSQAPQNSRELAVRNQFFTPRYIVQFLTDNTLGRIWCEMYQGRTRLNEVCEYFVRPNNEFDFRPKKDPRDVAILDPACGSGHFLLYAFDLLLVMYEEAWADSDAARSETTGHRLREDYQELDALRRAIPGLVLRHNLHGIDIDSRCAQIAQFALWMRAQRAFRDFGIRRSERPLIRKANVVVAEPIAADETMVNEFQRRLSDSSLARVFASLLDKLKLAGELGLLLRVEELGGKKQTSGQTGDLFVLAQERIRSAVAAFAEEFGAPARTKRRLFAEDALQGVGFLELSERRYSVLLMNPPFGDATPKAATYLEREYFSTRLDLFAAFCDRLLELSEPDGVLGAITPRDGFFKKTLLGWRELVLQHHMPVVADLGIGVLDAATVRVAAYVIAKTRSERPSRFLDLVDLPDREQRLRSEARTAQRAYDVQLSAFRLLPLCRFLYWLPRRLWEIYSSAEPLENRACTPRYGLTTLSDERFCRLFFEVEPETIGADRAWAFMSKGGDDYPYGGVSNCVVRWQDDGAEMAEVNRQANGQIAQTRRASKYYFRPAVAFSNRSVQFSVRWHPANFLFSVRGPAVIPLRASQSYLLGFFNSRLVRALIQMQTASQTYTSGVLKELRWVEPDRATCEAVERSAVEAFQQVRVRLATVETDPFFGGLVARAADGPPTTVRDYLRWRRRFVEQLNANLKDLQLRIDQQVSQLYGVSNEDVERCERVEEDAEPNAGFPPKFEFVQSDAEALTSYLFGVAIGRWRPRVVDEAPALDAAAPQSQFAASGPADVAPIVVDDPGHAHDLVSMVRAALNKVLSDASDDDVAILERALGSDLREWFAKKFFAEHISMYSGFGRSAPIYWQLATPSARYSIWMYAPALTRDTLYKLQNEYAGPKLAHEERRLEAIRLEFGPSPKGAERRQLSAQESFVEELRVFLDEIKRVAGLWNPNRDDGVVINFAPLWRLVPHLKGWQKELKATWDTLCAEEYEWAHVAMHLWPERVVAKCARDRSLAIAHGLEDVFWAEGDGGKSKPLERPKRSIEELIHERSSLAVKASLKNLLEAPIAGSNGGRRRGQLGTRVAEETR